MKLSHLSIHLNLLLLLLINFLLPTSLLAATISDYSPTSHWKCDETSSTRLDSTLSNNDLTDNNTVLSATGLLNNACDFEKGNSEYLSITDASQTALDDQTLSISLWVKFESTPSDERILSKWNNTGSQQSYEIYITGTKVGFQWYTATNNNGWAEATYTMNPGTWYHLLITADVPANSVKIYVNGSSQTISSSNYPSNSTIRDTSSPFELGSRSTSAIYYDGLLDEVTIFGSILTSTQVTEIYNAGTPLTYEADPDPTPTSTPSTTTSTLEDDDLLFMLAVIIFFLAFIWFGFIMNAFRKR